MAQVVGRLGLADVKDFGLAWDDCEALLKTLGFTAKVEITAASGREKSRVPLLFGTGRAVG